MRIDFGACVPIPPYVVYMKDDSRLVAAKAGFRFCAFDIDEENVPSFGTESEVELRGQLLEWCDHKVDVHIERDTDEKLAIFYLYEDISVDPDLCLGADSSWQ